MEARPIKGTAARSEDPALDAAAKAALVSSAKARAENLMIVDLLRNDLSRFCQARLSHPAMLLECDNSLCGAQHVSFPPSTSQPAVHGDRVSLS